MKILVSLGAVCVLFLIGLLGQFSAFPWLFGVLIPYVALAVFLGGMAYRVISLANIPVPFRIPTTCGQQKSLPWIKQYSIEPPEPSAKATPPPKPLATLPVISQSEMVGVLLWMLMPPP